MARPRDLGKLIKDTVGNLLGEILGRTTPRKGKIASSPTRFGRLTQSNRLRAERPTRDIDNFAYVHEVLANMPAANAAIRQLSEDVALDESGDPRAWTLSVKIDPLDDSDASKNKVSEFEDLCQGIFDDYALRTGVGDEAKNYVFKFLTAGDCFVEQTVTLDSKTGLGRIEKITELPTWQMRVKWSEDGDLTGYEQFLYKGLGSVPDAAWDIPAQIIHWKYHPTTYIQYGESIFAHLRGRWEQFKLVELDTIGAIHTHAVDPEVHLLGGEDGMRATDKEIADYEARLRDNPTDINRFYIGRQGEVDYTFPKTGNSDAVSKLLDAHRDLENRFVEAMVPGQPKSNAFDVTRRAAAVTGSQTYSRKVTSVRQDFTRYLKPSIFLELALHGIDWVGNPEQYGAKKISIELSWTDISESRLQREKRVLASWLAGLKSHKTSLRELGMNDPDGEIELLKREHESDDYPLMFLETPVSKAANAQTSANGEQGPGVSTPSDARVKMLQTLLQDPEDFREIIREEIAAAICDMNG
jgi:hypothetical protein